MTSTTISANLTGSPSDGAFGVNGGAKGAEGEGGSGGGIANAGLIDGEVVSTGRAEIRNSIVADNSAGDDVNNGSQPGENLFDADQNGASFFLAGYNLLGTNESVTDISSSSSDLLGTINNVIDPMLNGLNLNDDEAVPTLRPQAGSMAIDNGVAMGNNDYDGRGFQRVSGNGADIGAHELDAEPVNVDLSISNAQVSGTERISITNNASLPAQMDDYTLVFFPADYQDGGAACYSVNLYGELNSNKTFRTGVEGAANIRHPFTFDGVGPTCGSGMNDFLNDEGGAIGLYQGDAASLQGFVYGNFASSRVAVFTYGSVSNNGLESINDRLTAFDDALRVYPNPADDQLFVQLGQQSTDQPVDVQLFSQNGIRIGNLNPQQNGTTISVATHQLPTGVYYLRVISGDTIVTEKVSIR